MIFLDEYEAPIIFGYSKTNTYYVHKVEINLQKQSYEHFINLKQTQYYVDASYNTINIYNDPKFNWIDWCISDTTKIDLNKMQRRCQNILLIVENDERFKLQHNFIFNLLPSFKRIEFFGKLHKFENNKIIRIDNYEFHR